MGFRENHTEANEHQNHMSEDKIEKYYIFLSENVVHWAMENSFLLHRYVILIHPRLSFRTKYS